MNIPRLSLPDEVNVTGMAIIKENNVYETFPAHNHDFDELFFVFKGRAIHCVNGQHQYLEKGALVLMRPDDIHSFSPFNDYDFGMYSLGFRQRDMDDAVTYLGLKRNEALLPPLVILHGSDFSWVENKFEQLYKLHTDTRLKLFKAMLPELLLPLLTVDDGANYTSTILPQWLAELDEKMRRRDNYVAGLTRMLELCSYSQEYINRMFRLHLKTTPTEYINTLRMSYATELLLAGENSVLEICFMTGFNNLSYFYSVFNKLYGCSPKEFVKRYKSFA